MRRTGTGDMLFVQGDDMKKTVETYQCQGSVYDWNAEGGFEVPKDLDVQVTRLYGQEGLCVGVDLEVTDRTYKAPSYSLHFIGRRLISMYEMSGGNCTPVTKDRLDDFLTRRMGDAEVIAKSLPVEIIKETEPYFVAKAEDLALAI